MRFALLLSCLNVVSGLKVFEVSDLLKGRRSDELKEVLTGTGLLAVNLPQHARADALQGLCSCHSKLEMESTVLDDGVTQRSTLGTATIGDASPLLLPEEISGNCGSATADALDSLRDDVAMVSKAFTTALDRFVGQRNTEVILETKHNKQYTSVSSIVKESTNLEHFHIYSKAKTHQDTTAKTTTLDMHTDAGLFLAFVPAIHCDDTTLQDQSFFIEGQADPIQFPPNSIAIMLGAGAEHWLNTEFPLKATRHAVKMNPGEERAWYGMSKYASV